MTITTTTVEQTYAFAAKLAKKLKPGDIVTLKGDLGSGKTTFSQGLGKALGVKQPVTSPTFLVIKTYTLENEAIKRLNHVDLYRIENEKELKNLGLLELFADPHAVTLIEWPEKMGAHLPTHVTALQFEYIDETTRKITQL
ncbi:MAG TPA: tRNA (adenosine(37)-N6)-threonylcarbamoyltransferase complex ATPase subunit type 1 TsaE [Patescibacteria group bacterium]|nr:tRNA (adenosine(37)-N6)-threonylcarbamoyltransferase complex ATPase subunit type 1 TsaE [Patescibacteria group bacterium]